MTKKIILTSTLALLITSVYASGHTKEKFPDGTPIPEWFYETSQPDTSLLGRRYIITDYGVANDSTIVQTKQIQAVIDRASAEGGGVIVIPQGTYLSGSLFFRPDTHLYIEKEGTLKGSDDISDFAIIDTRLEGQNIKYFAALINAINADGFTLSGEGSVNGNGLRYWKSFWLRRQINSNCTNLEEMRPRLIYIANSQNISLYGVTLKNSPFWTTHLYRCRNVKLLNLNIYAPHSPVKAPSSDAVDIDVCSNVLIKNCYMSVNDDAIALKGGKGPWADKDTTNNGANQNIIIEDCIYGFCHSALTCGSESIHNRNIILRRTEVNNAQRLLWLKMRPDTPQNYEYILLEDISGSADCMLYAKPWTQFFDLKGRKDIPYSYSSNITFKNIEFICKKTFDIEKADNQYKISNFSFEEVKIKAKDDSSDIRELIENVKIKNLTINGKKQ